MSGSGRAGAPPPFIAESSSGVALLVKQRWSYCGPVRCSLRLVLVILLGLAGAPWAILTGGDPLSEQLVAASAATECPDCDEGCPPGRMVLSGCLTMCAFTHTERIVAIAPIEVETQEHTPLDDLGLGGLHPLPERTPPRLRA